MTKLLSTRARSRLWRLQTAVRQAARERDRLLRILICSRIVLTRAAQQDPTQEFICADQEYRYTVTQLHTFVQRHHAGAGLALEDIEEAPRSKSAKSSDEAKV